MSKVTRNFKVGKMLVLILDEFEKKDFHKIEIDEKTYDVNIVYDIPNALAIKSENDFVGKTVNFI